MGGDFAPENVVLGVIQASKVLQSGSTIVLYGNAKAINAIFEREKFSGNNVEVIDAPSVIEMGEHPAKAFQRKQDSSITVGFKDLYAGKIDAFASAGSTGAMMVGAVSVIIVGAVVKGQDGFLLGIIVFAREVVAVVLEKRVVVLSGLYVIDKLLSLIGGELVVLLSLVERPACHGQVYLGQGCLGGSLVCSDVVAVGSPRGTVIVHRQHFLGRLEVLHDLFVDLFFRREPLFKIDGIVEIHGKFAVGADEEEVPVSPPEISYSQIPVELVFRDSGGVPATVDDEVCSLDGQPVTPPRVGYQILRVVILVAVLAKVFRLGRNAVDVVSQKALREVRTIMSDTAPSRSLGWLNAEVLMSCPLGSSSR